MGDFDYPPRVIRSAHLIPSITTPPMFQKTNLRRHARNDGPGPGRTGVPTSRKTGSVIVPDEGGLTGILVCVTELKIGYARISTVDQDLTVLRESLSALGVDPKRIYVDHGPDRHEPRPTRIAPSARRLPQRRHARRDKARPPRPVRSRRT